ncbi:uncharacterized protein LOC123296014 [Chrysoperla carnea]|uniref:uncharacterized protein LOC123296014 n=1 Tax=Chrysoperla carnea TaxID=189513 RepID=UPI001D08A22A|nr:uncharacterized protein LOC123296014 [Chrysoperla carnea]
MNQLILVLFFGLVIAQKPIVKKPANRLHIDIEECKKTLYQNLKGVSVIKATELCTRVDECFGGMKKIGPDPAEKCLIKACADSRLKWETDKQCREFMNKLLEPIETYDPMQAGEISNYFQ